MKTFPYNHFYWLIFLWLSVSTSIAQNKITGNILDKTSSKVLPGITVQVLRLNDSTTFQTTTNTQGIFSMDKLLHGKYVISTNSIQYKTEQQHVELSGQTNSQITFRLEPAELSIEEVAITASPALVLKGDTMEFNANNFATREHAEADELVAQIPGVQIDEEGNITAHGEEVTRIIVDGKEFFSTDPRIALKTLPAEIIAKIQLIDERSEQSRFSGFDDGKRNKIINIVTKPEKRKGYFGKAQAGKGDTDKFGINTSINRFSGDMKYAINLMANNINETNFAEQGRGGARRGNNNTDRGLSDTYALATNYSNTFLDKKLEVNTDYNFKSLNTLTNTLSDIEYLNEKQANQFRNQTQFSDNLSKEHQFNARAKWNIDSLNRIDIAPNIRYTHGNRFNTSLSSTTINRDAPINKSDRSNRVNDNNLQIGISFTYMHRLKKAGRSISLHVEGNKNSNDALGLNLATTEYFKNALLSRIDTNNNQSNTNGYGSGWNSRLAITENIGTYSRLQANYNYRNTASYSNKETFEFLAETGQLGELRDRLSNEFRNDYNYHSTGLSYNYNRKDSLRIQIGLNYQHGVRVNNRTIPINLKTKADFSSFLPELTAFFRFSKDRNIEINYNTRTNTPNIGQLQDFVNNQNELRITNGNPNLEQEYNHTFRIQYKDINKETGKTLNTNFNLDYINNKIINSVLMTDTTIVLFEDITLGAGGQYTIPINVDGAYGIRLHNSYGIPIKPLKINFNSFSRLFYNKDFAKLNEDLVASISYGFAQSIGFNSNFSKKYIVGFHYNMDARYTENPLAQTKRYQVYNHRINNNVTVELFQKIIFNSTFMYMLNGGIMGAPSIDMSIWNASLGYKLLKRQNAELALKGFDILNNAQNVNRRVNENNISNTTSNTLNRYFLLSITYNLRQFGGKEKGGLKK